MVPCISLYRPGQTVTISKQTIHTGYSFLTGIERDVEVQEVKTNIFHCFSNKFINQNSGDALQNHQLGDFSELPNHSIKLSEIDGKNVTTSSSTLPAHKWVVVPSVLFDMKPVFTLQICKDKYYKSPFDNYDHENNDGDDNESLIIPNRKLFRNQCIHTKFKRICKEFEFQNKFRS